MLQRKVRRGKYYLWVWRQEKQDVKDYGCAGSFSSFRKAEEHLLYLCFIHKSQLIRGEVRCEVG